MYWEWIEEILDDKSNWTIEKKFIFEKATIRIIFKYGDLSLSEYLSNNSFPEKNLNIETTKDIFRSIFKSELLRNEEFKKYYTQELRDKKIDQIND